MIPRLRRLGSLRLTLALLCGAVLVLLAGILLERSSALPLSVVFALLAVNLCAAIATRSRLRSSPPLLLFHLGLATIALLTAVGRLTYLSGHVEVAEGGAFDSTLVVAENGVLHPWRLDRINFLQGPFTVDYATHVRRRHTRSHVLVEDARGRITPETVGDDAPLVMGGYRFYTSFNKGIALHLAYARVGSDPQLGALHLPSYPLNSHRQGRSWLLPDGSEEIKLWLRLEQPPMVQEASWRLERPHAWDTTLVVIRDDERIELRPGERTGAGQGHLEFVGIGGWMGYTIDYDPTRRWVLATALVCVAALGWYAAGRISRPLPGAET